MFETQISLFSANIIKVFSSFSLFRRYLFLRAATQNVKTMYRHANTNINPSQSSDFDTKSTKSSETRRRQIPLAFTNTEWGKEYAANPNWEHENLGKCNPTVRKGSRFRSGSDASASIPSYEIKSANPPKESSPTTTIPSATSIPVASSQGYSVMVAWNFFRRTFPPNVCPTFPDTSANGQRTSVDPQHEEDIEVGPWLEVLMRWDDFEQWQLKMLERSWCSPATSEEL